RFRARARQRRARRPAVLRLDRLPQVPRRSGPRRRTFGPDPQGRCRFPDLRRRPRAKLALQRRRRRRRDLPPSAHRTRRHADAVVQRLDRPEVPDRRRAVASGAVRALPVAGAAPGAARRDPCPGGARSPARRARALRITWDDRSQRPDSAWRPFTQRVLASVAGDDSTPPAAALWPDQLIVQFPTKIPEGMERPYFLMGAATQPVYQWRWTSALRTSGRAVAGLARGIERFDSLPAGSAPAAQAVYDHGQWRLVLTRALATPDTADDLQFRTGRAIPVAFFGQDGSNGEFGTRMAVSTWYF